MKKVLLLATAFLFVTGVAMADKEKRKNAPKEKPAALKKQKQRNPAAKTRKSQQLKCNSQECLAPVPPERGFLCRSENVFQFFQVGNRVGGFQLGRGIDMVHEYQSIPAFMAPWISASRLSPIMMLSGSEAPALFIAKSNISFFGLQAVTGLRSDHVREKAIDPAVADLAPLCFLKTIGDEV